MYKCCCQWLMGLVMVTALAGAGCKKQTGLEGPRGGKAGAGQSMAQAYREGISGKTGQDADLQKPRVPDPPPAPKMPEVKMPDKLLQTCLVKVGDAMPEAELADLPGKPHSLRSLAGKNLTVVLFWSSDNMYAVQAVEYVQLDVAEPFGPKGVQLVGINVKDSPDDARKVVEEAGAKYVNLLDPEGAYFAKVATEKLPRVYLLDASGKVLWFDIEYSNTTRRDLERAIKFVLGEPEEAKK